MGAASRFKTRIEDQSNGICDLPGVDSIVDLTPFQRQVLDYAQKVEQEKKEEKRKEMREEAQRGRTPTRNSRSGTTAGSQTSQGETVRYVNENDSSDIQFVD